MWALAAIGAGVGMPVALAALKLGQALDLCR
jgi:hypothetical protein